MQTLLQGQGYEGYVSVDPILEKILEPEGWVTELDQGVQAGEIDLCGSLAQLQARLADRPDPSVPVFSYTQPQDIHIATITRGGGQRSTTRPTVSSTPRMPPGSVRSTPVSDSSSTI